jgi:thiamine pyrophosphokinase
MKRCVIIGGAPINDYGFIKSKINEDDFIAVCDCGLRHLPHLCVEPDLIVGDFDSYEAPKARCEIITLPCEKDDTDTFFAVKEALRRGFDEFLLLGVIGGRLDHSLGNISILLYLDSLGKRALACDDHSEIEIVSDNAAYIPDSYLYFSLLNVSGIARGITIKNAKYPLDNASIECEYQYGVSNETLKGKTAEVSVGEGRLLLIKIVKE